MSDLTVTSDLGYVEDAFAWARKRALDWVQTDAAPGHLPSYWAGYPSRAMFYSRDVCHQAVGAHLLGLDAENFACSGISPARRPRPASGTRSGRSTSTAPSPPSTITETSTSSGRSPRCSTSTTRALGQYDWTGDRRWIDDPDLAAYYLRSVEDFVAAHDSDGDGLPEAPGTGDIFDGAASYNEHPDRPLTVAADGLATQYAALNAVAQAPRHVVPGSGCCRSRSEFASWWDEETGTFARGRGQGSAARLRLGAGDELVRPDARTERDR